MRADRARVLEAYDNLCEHAVVLGLDVDGGLVRFLSWTRLGDERGEKSAYDFEEDVACSERVALLLLPLRDAALCHGRAHSGHDKLGERMPPRRRVNVLYGDSV